MSINNKRSYTEYTVTRPTTDFAIGFIDFNEGSKDTILVTLNGVLVESLGYATIRKNKQTVSITPAITEGTVRLTRETGIDDSFHKFTAGALFSAKSVDENFEQVRHSQQEVRDGFEYLAFNTTGIVQEAKAATQAATQAADTVADLLIGVINTEAVRSTSTQLTQEVLNNGVVHISQLQTIVAKAGSRVFVKGSQGGYFTYVPSKSTINNGVTIFNGWVRDDKGYVTFRDGGAIGDGITEEWANIKKVIAHGFENGVIVDGEGLTYLTSAIYMNSNLYLRNTNFKNSSNKNMLSVLTTDANPNTWFENVTFENVHIDGMRHVATGMTLPSNGEDGGRHGFRIVKRCRNIRFINSGADNCCVDGLILYPLVDRTVAQGYLVRDIVFEGDCHFNGNGRWGISADAVNGFHIGDGTVAKGNGLDLEVGAVYDSGKASRKYLTHEYGGAIDFEEYHGNYSSSNISIGAVDFRDNASSSLCFTRTGILVRPSAGIRINSGGLYNAGISTNQSAEATTQKAAIRMSGYTVHGQDANMYRNVVIDNIDCGGGSIYLDGVNNSDLYGYLNCSKVYLRFSEVRTDNEQVFELLEASSNYESPTARATKTANFIGAYTDSVGKFHFLGRDSVNLSLFASGKVQGSINLIRENSGIRTEFCDSNGVAHLTVGKYGALYPANPDTANIGHSALRYKDIYLTNAPNVASDRTLKKDIEQLSAVELLVAQELKGLIKKYRLKSDDVRLRVGVIAQEVENVFSKNGLNALDYNMIDKADGVYSIRYEELVLFIIASI